MPGARCTGGLVCNGESGCAHEHTGSAEASGIPCVMVLRLMPRSPRRRIHLVTVVGGFWRPLNPVGLKLSPPTWHQQRVSGPHGFAVRSNVVRPARFQIAHEVQLALRPPWRADAVASTTSHPAFVTTRDRPSCRNGTAGAKPLIWGRREAEILPAVPLCRNPTAPVPRHDFWERRWRSGSGRRPARKRLQRSGRWPGTGRGSLTSAILYPIGYNMYEVQKIDEFNTWLSALGDQKAVAKIASRIERSRSWQPR